VTLPCRFTNLTQPMSTRSDGTLTRVRYTYDGSIRLSTVTVDLSPSDSSVANNYSYVTSYTYDGTSKRVASIAQTDGSLLQIAYDGSNRVASFTQTVTTGVTRTTSFDYGPNGRTTITDPAGQKTVMVSDMTSSDLRQIIY